MDASVSTAAQTQPDRDGTRLAGRRRSPGFECAIAAHQYQARLWTRFLSPFLQPGSIWTCRAESRTERSRNSAVSTGQSRASMLARSIWLWAGPQAPRCAASSRAPVTTSWSREMPKYSACWKWRAPSDCRRPQPAASGEARINLRVGGGWAGFAAAVVTGTAQLHSVRARVRGLSEPVEISSATIALTPSCRRSSEADRFGGGQHLARLADHSQTVRHAASLPDSLRSSCRRVCDRQSRRRW